MGEFGRRVRHLDEHAVDAAAALDVLVVADLVAVRSRHVDDVAQLDLLLERDLQLLQLGAALGDSIRAVGDDEVDERVGLLLELVGAGNEVGLALEEHDRADVAVDLQGYDALVIVAVVALGARSETLLTQELLRGVDGAVGLLEGLLAVHHSGAGGIAQGFDVLCGE